MTVMAHETLSISLPELSGGRARARALVEERRSELRGALLVLDCRQTVAGSQSFADEIVRRTLLGPSAAEKLRVEFPPDLFAKYIVDAASDHGVANRVEIV